MVFPATTPGTFGFFNSRQRISGQSWLNNDVAFMRYMASDGHLGSPLATVYINLYVRKKLSKQIFH